MLLVEFQKNARSWKLNEKKLSRKKATKDELVSPMLSGDSSNLQETLESRSKGGSYLDRIKRRIRRDMSQNGSAKAVLANFLTQKDMLEGMQDQFDSILSNINDLDELVGKKPEKTTSTSSIEEAADAVGEARNTPSGGRQPPSDEIGNLADSIRESDIQDYIDNQGHFSSRRTQHRTGNRIREIQPRYYTYQTKIEDRETDPSDDYKIVDPDTEEEVQKVEGYESVEVQEDGTVVARGSNEGLAQHQEDKLQIQKSDTSSPTQPPITGGSQKQERYDKIKKAKEDHQHAFWACAVLSLIKEAREVIENIQDDIDHTMRDLQRLPRKLLVQGLAWSASNLQQLAEESKLLSDVQEGLQEAFATYDQARSKLLEVGNQLTIQPGEQPSLAVCNKRHRSYCQAHSAMSQLWNDIKDQIPSVAGPPVNLPFDPEKLIEELEEKFGDFLEKSQCSR